MPDITELKKKLQQIKEAIQQKLPDIAVAISIAAKGIAERKIKDKGFGYIYSTTPVPAWFFHGRELNAQGTKFLEDRGVNPQTGVQGEGKKKRRKKKTDPDPGHFDKETTWGEFRGAQGLQNKFVDLSYSNKMWAAMGPVKIVQQNYIYVAPLGATNTEAQDKMNWNYERYGDFVGKTIQEVERDLLTTVAVDELVAVIDQFRP